MHSSLSPIYGRGRAGWVRAIPSTTRMARRVEPVPGSAAGINCRVGAQGCRQSLRLVLGVVADVVGCGGVGQMVHGDAPYGSTKQASEINYL
jgi:hypothetical protein